MWTMGDDFQYQYAETWFKEMDKLIHYVNKVNTSGSTENIDSEILHKNLELVSSTVWVVAVLCLLLSYISRKCNNLIQKRKILIQNKILSLFRCCPVHLSASWKTSWGNPYGEHKYLYLFRSSLNICKITETHLLSFSFDRTVELMHCTLLHQFMLMQNMQPMNLGL